MALAEFAVLEVFLLFAFFLEAHVFIDLLLFVLDHFLLFLHDRVVLLVDELKRLLFASGQLVQSRFLLLV